MQDPRLLDNYIIYIGGFEWNFHRGELSGILNFRLEEVTVDFNLLQRVNKMVWGSNAPLLLFSFSPGCSFEDLAQG